MATSKSFEFYFDVVCPFAYIASTQVEKIAARTNAKMILKPVLLGGIFKANEQEVAAKGSFADTMNDTKRKYMSYDLARFVRYRGVKLNWPQHHPKRSILALRVLLYLSSPESPYTGTKLDMWSVVQRLYRAYWVENVDISDETALAAVVASIGASPDVVSAANSCEVVKQSLTTRTDEAIERGLFGVPTFFVNNPSVAGSDRLIYGQDQLEDLEHALGGPSHLELLLQRPKGRLYETTFFFDFSSPYTYLAFLRIERLWGAENVKFVPVLLGAIFKGVGQNNTPAATMSASRRSWSTSELFRLIGEKEGAPFTWASRFPIRTIFPLRFAIAAGPDTPAGRRLIAAFFRAFWGEDADSNDPQVCVQIANSCGLDGEALLQAANTKEVKDALHQNTTDALKKGVFGLPMVAVHKPKGTEWYWGNDRLLWAFQDAHYDPQASL